MSTFRVGRDLKMIAGVNGTPIKMAYGYISRGGGDELPKKRGGTRTQNVTNEVIKRMVEFAEMRHKYL